MSVQKDAHLALGYFQRGCIYLQKKRLVCYQNMTSLLLTCLARYYASKALLLKQTKMELKLFQFQSYNVCMYVHIQAHSCFDKMLQVIQYTYY